MTPANRRRHALHLSRAQLRQRLQRRVARAFPATIRARQRLSEQVWLLADFLAAKAPDFVAGTLARGAHPGPRTLPSQSGLRRPGKRNRTAPPGRRRRSSRLKPDAAAWPAPLASRPRSSKSPRPSPTRTCCRPSTPHAPGTLIVADGFSCREQIDQLGHRRAIHFAEVLAAMSHDK